MLIGQFKFQVGTLMTIDDVNDIFPIFGKTRKCLVSVYDPCAFTVKRF